MFLHIDVQSEGMESVYLSLLKVDYEPNLQLKVNSVSKDLEQISFDLNSLNQVSGLYQMNLIGSNGAAGKTINWDLGTIKVWFKEGQEETTNNHIPTSFLPHEEL